MDGDKGSSNAKYNNSRNIDNRVEMETLHAPVGVIENNNNNQDRSSAVMGQQSQFSDLSSQYISPIDYGTFQTKDKLFRVTIAGNEFRILIFQANETLYFKGAIDIRVVFGSLDCFGSKITSKVGHDGNEFSTIVSPHFAGLLPLKSEELSLQSILDVWNNRKWTKEDVSIGLPTFLNSLNPENEDNRAVLESIRAIAVIKPTNLQTLPRSEEQIIKKLDNQQPSNSMSIKSELVDSTFRLIPDAEANRLHDTCNYFVIPNQWKPIVQKITQDPFFGEMLICGAKSAGKSSLLKYLTNTSLNHVEKVAILDLDLGQPELTPPGIISLNIINHPLLGPSFTNQILVRPLFREMHFLGTPSAAEKLKEILECALQLFAQYKYSSDPRFFATAADGSSKRIPIIINTHGWIDGPGHHHLLQIIQHLRPSKLIQIFESSNAGPIVQQHQLHGSPTEIISLEPAFIHTSYSTVLATEKRIQQILSYTGYMNSIFCIPWSALRIHVLDAEVNFSQIMFILNASIVGLVCDYAEYNTIQKMSQKIALGDVAEDLVEDPDLYESLDESLPQFLLEPPASISSKCVGLGIITSIDMKKKSFYIATNLPLEQLEQVNTIVKGQIEVPAALLIASASLNSPYLTADSILDEGSGSATLTVRNNISRKPFNR